MNIDNKYNTQNAICKAINYILAWLSGSRVKSETSQIVKNQLGVIKEQVQVQIIDTWGCPL